ncbi:hypothetical protein niasHT_016654 [Heterodera trifolii]|uniref:PRORP domain-containing protein n=1 Tax=Heterodera trifolii TaxID=157864 RepID=A0ABD2J9F8_9BILA
MPGKEAGLLESRKNCHRSRDLFFECLSNNDEDEGKCQREHAIFSRACPATWVQHFMRKHKMERTPEGTKEMHNKAEERRREHTAQQQQENGEPKRETGQIGKELAPTQSHHLQERIVRDTHLQLVEYYKTNQPKQGLDLLNSLIEQGQLNRKLLLDGVKMLALKFAGNDKCRDGDDGHITVPVLREMCARELGENLHIVATVELLLDACEKKWDRMSELMAKAVFKTDCFNLLAGMALARHELDTLEKVCQEMSPKVPFSQEPRHPFWAHFLNFLRGGGADGERLMKLYMDQLVMLDHPVDEHDAFHLKTALECYGKWKFEIGARVNHRSLECSHCSLKLVPSTIEPHKFNELRGALAKVLYDGATKMNRATSEQVLALMKTIKEMKRKISEQQQQSTSRRPLVVDALNLVDGKPEQHQLGYVRSFFNSLERNGFSPILVVTRCTFPSEFIHCFREKGHIFDLRSKSTKIHDDLFTLNAALLLGPDAHLMSNDGFRDYAPAMAVDPSLFSRWVKTRLVRFWTPKMTKKESEYLLPNAWHSQGDPSNGYHILAERRQRSRQFVYCIRTN